MEKTSEVLIRSAIHDMANVLAGVRGIIDLNLPDQPINQRDRDRLEAVIDEGITTLDRCRHLTMETLPENVMEPGAYWRDLLLEELKPMGVLFRCGFELVFEGEPEWDQWPGKLLRGYARAITRQTLPYAKTSTLSIQFSATAEEWRMRWRPAASLPESIQPGPEERPMDICSRWAVRLGAVLDASLSCEAGSLLARIPRT